METFIFSLVVYFLFGYGYACGKHTDNLLEFLVILVFWPTSWVTRWHSNES